MKKIAKTTSIIIFTCLFISCSKTAVERKTKDIRDDVYKNRQELYQKNY